MGFVAAEAGCQCLASFEVIYVFVFGSGTPIMNAQDKLPALIAPWERRDDHHFSPWRVPASERMMSVVSGVLRQVRNYERHKGHRKRARSEASQGTFEAIVTAIVCDLAHHHITGRPHGIAITRSKVVLGRRSRYKSPVETEMLPTVLDHLHAPEMAFIRQIKGSSGVDATGRTVILPGPRLVSRIRDFYPSDVGHSHSGETIELRDAKERDDTRGKLLEYEDTATTIRYRAELREINEWIAGADIAFDDSAAPDKITDANDRWLRRIFNNGSFKEGGRLFGGFWQSLRKSERAEGLIIEDEAVASLDFGQMTPRILYGMAGVSPPSGDLYCIPGLEHFREGVKKVLSAATFADKPLTRKPRGTKPLLPNAPFADILAKITAAHPVLAAQFWTGIGHRAQFIESQILIRVLLELKEREVVALPVHDAIVVKRSDADLAEDAMKNVFKDVTGVDGQVTRDT